MTVEDFEQLPDELARHRELVDGELIDVSGNTLNHNLVRDLLGSRLLLFTLERRLGRVVLEQEFDFDGNVHGPDISFFGPHKEALADPSRRVQHFVPDLAIEVLSRNDRMEEILGKLDRYIRCGVREAWLLAIESRIALVFTPEGERIVRDSGRIESALIPGFSASIGDLFDGR